jgi:hypothetical protein
MSRYSLSKLIVNDIVQMERSDRFKSHKLSRTPHGPILVRELHAAGASTNYLADRFGCTPEAIRQCITFKTYTNV